MPPTSSQVLVASNRLPIEAERTSDGLEVHHSPGGLSSALHDLLDDQGGTWIGWAGVDGEVELDQPGGIPYDLVPVPLSAQEREDYYQGFCNEIIWPLFHDLHPYCDFQPESWETYKAVNRRFAQTAHEQGDPGQPLWVHDYHLMTAGQALRGLGDDRPLGFFLHIPFPGPDLLQRLPWHPEILEALLDYDVIGFQTSRDLANFRACLVEALDDVYTEGGQRRLTIDHGGRASRAGVFPISIDFEEVAQTAKDPDVEERFRRAREQLAVADHTYLVGVERLDYTKGIPERLQAFRRALERYPELRGRVTLIQHVNPSRQEIPQYQVLTSQVEREVGRTNGQFGKLGWVPVRYTCGWLDFQDLLALYRLAQVALVTPLRDGMNLVAKEYCAAKEDGDGVLVLSRFAGATEELGEHALVVNPHDVDQMAQTIYEACTMDPADRRKRMSKMRAHLAKHDVHRWAKGFMGQLTRDPPPAQQSLPGLSKR